MPNPFRIMFKPLIWTLLGVSAVYAILITPANPIMRIFRREISDIASNVIIGPYPVESDIKRLKDNGIVTIISLLDPNLPYENQLLKQEISLAKQYKLQLLNFPMASILGQKLGAYYENNAQAAADAIAKAKGKIYLHCYLGIHRVATVKDLLETRQIKVGHYTLQEGERNQQALHLDKAEKSYREGEDQQAKQHLDAIKKLSPAALLLYGWVDLRQGKIEAARKHFTSAATEMPQIAEPLLGLGYCSLRENNLASAEIYFSEVIKSDANNAEALNGMGQIRYRQSRLSEATDYLNRALHSNTQHVEAIATLKRIKGTP